MSELTEDTSRTDVVSPRIKHTPVRALNQAGAAIIIRKGQMICKRKGTNLAEIAESAFPRTDLIPLGIAACEVDMTGLANGALSVATLAGGWHAYDTGTAANEIVPGAIASLAYMFDGNTLYATDLGGTLSAWGPVVFADTAEDGGIAAYVDFELSGVVHEVARLMAAQAAAPIQKGTGTLVLGVSAAIAATITATSTIVVTAANAGASAALGRLDAPMADRVVGAPGSFIVRSFDALNAAEADDVSTFNWIVVG